MSLESYSWLEATFFFKHSGTQARKSCANLQALLELTDYGHTMANFLILCGPNSNTTQSQINIWYLDVKPQFFVEMMVDYWKTWARDSNDQNGC